MLRSREKGGTSSPHQVCTLNDVILRRTLIPIVVIACGLGAIVAGLELGGAANDAGLVDVGAFVRWGLPAAKLISNLAAAVTIGALVFACFALPFQTAKTGGDPTPFDRTMTLATAASTVWVLFTAAVIVLTYATIDTTAYNDADYLGAKLWLFVSSVSLGQNLVVSLLLASVTTVLAAASRGHLWVAIAAAVALSALIPIAQSGHAAGSTNHGLAVGALLLHVWGASVWIGGLIAFAFAYPLMADSAREILKRYSSLALVSFIVVAFSGYLSAQLRITTLEQIATGYGFVVLAKVIVIVALGICGAIYRTRIIAGWTRVGTATSRWRLVVAELALMGIASGFAVALAQTAPPTAQVSAGTSPAEILTGSPLPPEISVANLLTQWSIDPIWLTVSVGGAVFYIAGVRRLRARGDTWHIGRTISWVAGCLVLLLVTNGGLNRYQEYLFSAHMTAHMMLTMVIPALLVLGAPVTLIARAVDRRDDGSWGVREWTLWAVHTPYARFISGPVVAAVIFALSLWVFYYTPIVGWAVREHLGHQWMTIHFLISGYLFVQALIGIDPGPHRTAYPVRLLVLLGTMAFHAFFGVAIMAQTGLIEASWYGAMGRTWGAVPLVDQQIGGGIAWSIGEIPTVILALAVALAWARDDQKVARRLDRNADRTGEAELAAYNAMLTRMGENDRSEQQ